MSDLVAAVIMWAWKRREIRHYVVNFGFVVFVGIVVFFYVNFKHGEAIASIMGFRQEREMSDYKIESHLKAIEDDVRYTREKVDFLYRERVSSK